MGRATVGKMVAIDRGDYYMLQAEPHDSLSDSARLVGVERANFAVRDRAVGAIACTYVAHQHEGRSAIRKAFADIRAARFLPNRIQFQLAQNPLGAEVLRQPRPPN